MSLGQPSLGGGYTGVNPMGLFTLMAPPPDSAPDWFYPEAGYDVELEASAGGRVTATATVKRQGPTAAGVTEMELAPPTKGGIYGNLYLPKHTTGRGYPSLALAYFKVPGLPRP